MAALDSLLAASRAIVCLEDGRRIVAVDGVDGAGKTTFADRLADLVERPTVRASVDDFHHPRAHRYRRGRESPDGFYVDSFDYQCLTGLLLEPFRAGAPFRRRAFDHRSDTPVTAPQEDAATNAVLILDGLRELRFHDPRHTLGTRAVDQAESILELKEWMGRADDHAVSALQVEGRCGTSPRRGVQ